MDDRLFPAVACLQYPITLGAIEPNLEQVSTLLAAAPPTPGTLVLLPEIWATGFDYPRTRELGQRTPEILGFMQKLARSGDIFLAGSLTDLHHGADLPQNTMFVIGPDGLLGTISKQHLFGFWQEDQYYRSGQAGPLISTPHGPLGGLICYDLRFPEVAKRQTFAGARLLLVSAQWPLSRLDHWQTLLRARAIENQCYIGACNGCGFTGSMEMAGHSMIVAPDGQVLREAGTDAVLIAAVLDPARVDEQRRRFFPAGKRPWLSADDNKIVDRDQLSVALAPLRRQGSRIGFTHGGFDILQVDHIRHLEATRSRVDCLVVGLLSDDSAQEVQGPQPLTNGANERARVLAALGCVDYVVLCNTTTPQQWAQAIAPDILLSSPDGQWAEDT